MPIVAIPSWFFNARLAFCSTLADLQRLELFVRLALELGAISAIDSLELERVLQDRANEMDRARMADWVTRDIPMVKMAGDEDIRDVLRAIKELHRELKRKGQ